MRTRDFDLLLSTGLLREVEEIVVAGHRETFAREGRQWSAPDAYRWLRYEDPEPVERLAEGVDKLRQSGVRFDARAVDKACEMASEEGFLN